MSHISNKKPKLICKRCFHLLREKETGIKITGTKL
jgi:hypothetical protein